MPDQFSQIIIDSTAVTDGHHTNDPMRPIHGIGNTETAHAILPEPFQFPLKRLADRRVFADGSKRRLDRSLDVRMEMAEDVGHMRWNVKLEYAHYREDFLVRTSGSPNTSSNDSPFAPLA